MRDAIPDECQLCRPLDYRGDEINEPEGMVEVAREDGGTKIIHCCERCADELFGIHDFTAYDGGGSVACTDGGEPQETGTERETEAVVCPNPECDVDQRWTRRGVMCCPECAAKLVIACEMCNSGAVERVRGLPRCSEHVDEAEPRTIYIASSFSLTDRVQRVYEVLEAAGHEVPDVWWNEDLKQIDLPDDEWYQHPDVQAIAERHWNSIEDADTYVLVCPEEEPKKYNGANVELGYAHANGLDCYAIGALERSAMYVPVTRVGSVDDLLAEISGGGRDV